MTNKGYNIENINTKNKCLHEYLNEYGLNLNHKENEDIFSSSIKSKKCLEAKGRPIKK